MLYRRASITTVITVIVGLLALLGAGLACQEPSSSSSGAARGKRPSADFTLPLFKGGQITLSELRGKPVVINFWASWCPPCREESPTLEKVWRAYKDKGIIFIGVDIQDREADALAFLKVFDITFPNGPDPKAKIAFDYGISGIPETFFVNREGMIVNRWIGAINEKLLILRVEELLR